MAISKAFVTIADGSVDPDSPLDAALMTGLRDNDIHNREWLGLGFFAGAVENHNHNGVNSALAAGIADGTVTENKIATSSVTQGKLKTALNTISLQNPGTVDVAVVLAGGRYCFLPAAKMAAGANPTIMSWFAGGAIKGAAGDAIAPLATTADIGIKFSARFTTRNVEVTLLTYHFEAGEFPIVSEFYVQYVAASPPYDPFGLGECLLFVYALIERATAKVVSVWTAEDPPWANNGPTPVNPVARARRLVKLPDPFRAAVRDPAEIDRYFRKLKRVHDLPAQDKLALMNVPISQAEKNADMDLIPHPFPHDPATHQVVLLAGPVVEQLWLRESYCGDPVAEIVLNDHLVIDNAPIAGATKYPRGTLLAAARFKAA